MPSFPARGPQPATRRGRGRSGILLVCLLAVLLAAAGGIIYYARGSNSPQATATDGPGSSGRSTPGTVGGAA
ncbi:MAG: hypothetical protein LBQ06_01880, partial [Frankiaceae bacterium]|nr:hypothetical protein [Frankiaceae bacterium]